MSTTVGYEAHPATDLFPMMDEAALNELADDIKAHGLIDPIVLHDGKILDGRNRLKACERAGVEPRYETWQADGMSPTEWVISVNLHRRHLTKGQQATIGLEAMPMLAADAKKRQQEAGRLYGEGHPKEVPPNWGEPLDTRRARESTHQAAALVGVGHRSIERAAAVKKYAPDLYAEVQAGTKTLNKAVVEAGFEPSGSRKDRPSYKPAPTFEVKTERDLQRAEAHRRRVHEAIINLSGMAMALTKANLEAAMAAASKEERNEWLQMLRESVPNIRKVEARLREAS